MKVVLIGSNGQLGTDIFKVLQACNADVVAVEHSECDISEVHLVDGLLDATRPDVVINTAAFHKVEECENDPSRAFETNAIGAFHLARACERYKTVLVHFSTDYVFDGCKGIPYVESDLPSPLNVYGASKVAGEHLIASQIERFIIIRTSGLYGHAGSSGKGGNFVENILKKANQCHTLRVVNDQILTPTATADLARVVPELVVARDFGLYHVSCGGECSWYQFARKIFELEELNVNLIAVPTNEFPSSVRRPPYSVLGKDRLQGLGLCVPPWDESLERYLKERRSINRRTVSTPS